MYSNLEWDDKVKNLIVGMLRAQSEGRVSSSCKYKHHIHTPFKLCQEIVSQVPVPSAGSSILVMFNMEFIWAWSKIVDFSQVRVYYYTTDTLKAAVAQKIWPQVHVITELENLDMKFDVAIGNPPYEATDKAGRKDQANNLWSKFVQRGVQFTKEGGCIAMITPTSWLSPAADIGKGKTGIRFFNSYFQTFRVMVLNVNECARHFDVGSTFSYFVLEKTEDSRFTTKVITPESRYDIDLRSINFLPTTMNQHAISINQKVLSNTNKFGFAGNNLPETRVCTSKVQTLKFSIPSYHTSGRGGTYWYIETPISTANKPKIIVSISGNYSPVYDLGGMSFTSMCVAYYLKSTDNMDSVRSFLNSKLINFIMLENKYTGWVSPVIRDLPDINKTKIWTDQELYQHFGLTQEEIDYIEATVK